MGLRHLLHVTCVNMIQIVYRIQRHKDQARAQTKLAPAVLGTC